jgi:predicted chitinase
MAAIVINQKQLLEAVPNLHKPRLDAFVASFNMWAVHFGIDTPLRVAHYLAQVFHESAYLRCTEENLNYSAEALLRVFPKYFNKGNVSLYTRNPQRIANRAYANRMGNGSEGSGDGYRYRGRGYIGTTGKANYEAYAKSEWCVGDLMSHPELLSQSPDDQKSSMFFWWKNNCNKFADADDVTGLTKRINGGLNGFESRKDLLAKFKKVLNVK